MEHARSSSMEYAAICNKYATALCIQGARVLGFRELRVWV